MSLRNFICLVPFALSALALADPDPKPSSEWSLTSSIDAYYGFASPYTGHGATRTLRQYDVMTGAPRLALAQVMIKYADPKTGFGLSLTPWAGDTADISMASDTSTSAFAKYLGEGYITYSSPDQKFVADFGKWFSPFGYEGIDSSTDEIYSRGLLSTIGQPNFHSGLRLSYQLSPTIGISGYATSGWNQTERPTQGLSWGGQLRLNPDDSESLTASFLTGLEGQWNGTTNGGAIGGIGFFQPGVSNTTLGDLTLTKKFGPVSFALDGTYGTAANLPNSGTWYGAALIGKDVLNKRVSVAARIESMADTGGIRFGVPCTVQSAALEGDYNVSDRETFRLELRRDQSNNALFNSNARLSKDQTTLNLAYYIKFG